MALRVGAARAPETRALLNPTCSGRSVPLVPLKVLIVDDNASVRRLLRASIERDEYWDVCDEAENGAVAVEKVKQSHPDVVILDMQMPVMNGLDAARQIRPISPKTAIVMMTLYAKEDLLQQAREAGIQRVFSKLETLSYLKEWLKLYADGAALEHASMDQAPVAKRA